MSAPIKEAISIMNLTNDYPELEPARRETHLEKEKRERVKESVKQMKYFGELNGKLLWILTNQAN